MTSTRTTYACYCQPCGKEAYTTRRAARRVRKRVPPDGRGALNAYPCPHGTGYWHLGHLPAIPDARDTLRRRRTGT